MYGAHSGINVPTACLTRQDAWDDLIADIWAALLGTMPGFSDMRVVAELGPGASTKVMRGLGKAGYSGKLFLVDEALEIETGLMACARNYAFETRFIRAPFHEAPARIRQPVDLVILSHVLDDWMMRQIMKGETHSFQENVFDWQKGGSYAPAPTKDFFAAWQAVRTDEQGLARAKAEVFEECLALLQALRPRLFVISQYPSATLYESGLAEINAHTQDIFSALKQRLAPQLVPQAELQALFNRQENYGHHHIGTHILDAENWLAGILQTSGGNNDAGL